MVKGMTHVTKGRSFLGAPLFPLGLFELSLLVFQFVIGMYLNLFVNIPAAISFSRMMSLSVSYDGFGFVMFHMMLGMLIAFVSLGMLVMSFFNGHSLTTVISLALFLSILLAGINGLLFLFGGQNNINSYLMSIGFILSIIFDMLLIMFVNAGQNIHLRKAS